MTKKVVYPKFTIESLSEPEQLSHIAHRFGHDIGNPLTSIISFGSVLKRCSNDPTIIAKLPEYTEAILREAWRVNLLNERLVMLFSRRSGAPETITLANAITLAQQKLNARLGVEITTSFIGDPNDIAFTIDADQCTALLLELLLNAHNHGLRIDGPQLTVESHQSEQEFGFKLTNRVSALPECELEKLFLPFFSWPESNKNSGIGLCVAYSIAERAGAKIGIAIETEPELSFSIVLTFPNSKKPIAGNDTKNNDAPEIPNDLPKNINLLLIEDEFGVSSAIEKILTFLIGNKTNLSITVATGLDALEKLKENKIDLILCDLNLKGSSGKDIFAEIKKSHPELISCFAFITGDRGKQTSIEYLHSTGRPFLFKPFEPEDLLDLVFELLSEMR